MVKLPGKPGLHEDIVRVSIELGSELGEGGLTMRAIASRLGVSATALYQHFESKAAILREIRFLGMRDLEEAFESLRPIEDPIERLQAMARRYIDFALAQPWLYRVLFQEDEIDWTALTSDERDRLTAPRVMAQRVIAQCQELGRMRQDIDAYHAAILLWTSLHGLASLLIGGRISDQHPAHPVADREAFIASFTGSMVHCLETTQPTAAVEPRTPTTTPR